MSPDERALLAAVAAAPDDDLPRLVYADWLDENGRPERAECVRLAVEYGRLTIGDPESATRSDSLYSRRFDLAETRVAWQKEVRGLLPPNKLAYFTQQYGIPLALSCTLKYFLDHAATIFAAVPLLQLNLHRPSPRGLAKLAGVPEFARVPGLGFEPNELTPECVSALQRLHLGHVRSFTLYSGLIYGYGVEAPEGWMSRTEEAVVQLVQSALLIAVRKMDFTGAGIGDDGGMALATTPHLPSLNLLVLYGNRFSDRTRAALRDRFQDRVFFNPDDYRGRLRYSEIDS